MSMVGIVLAGGTGTRLFPITKGASKQLLPVFDKPMIYYPLGTLMLAGIREIAIITTPQDLQNFQLLLGSGEDFGVNFTYLVQPKPEGLAQAFIIAEEFIGNDSCALILGDNIFHGTALGNQLRNFTYIDGAQIFGYHVANPENYGVAEIDSNGRVISIEEKPTAPKSQIAVPGLYFYDNTVIEKAKSVVPSDRGELEISSVNELYLNEGKLQLEVLQRGTAWLDTGTFVDLYEASSYVKILQERQGYKISCLEEIGFRNGWLSQSKYSDIIRKCTNETYANYLRQVLEEIH
jgi:glucose-1-phosphate thymidylyltransferase